MVVIYITGTSSGIGKAIASAALERGFTVHGFARRNTLEHENYHHHTADLSNLDVTRSIRFDENAGAEKIVLINNAGTEGEIKYLGEIAEQNIIAGYHINIISPHLLMNKFISAYREHPAEKIIINLTSGAASSAYDGWSIYCSTKAAVDMLSKCADAEQQIAGVNFRILSIAPGVVDTPMQDKLRETNARNFSGIQKFIDLKKNEQLADPRRVAQKFIDIVVNPAQLSGVIHRLSS